MLKLVKDAKTLLSNQYSNEHQQDGTQNQEGFLCPVCLTTFQNDVDLSSHYAEEHSVESPGASRLLSDADSGNESFDTGSQPCCSLCSNLVFESRTALQTHLVTVHGGDVTANRCGDVLALRKEIRDGKAALDDEKWYSNALKKELERLQTVVADKASGSVIKPGSELDYYLQQIDALEAGKSLMTTQMLGLERDLRAREASLERLAGVSLDCDRLRDEVAAKARENEILSAQLQENCENDTDTLCEMQDLHAKRLSAFEEERGRLREQIFELESSSKELKRKLDDHTSHVTETDDLKLSKILDLESEMELLRTGNDDKASRIQMLLNELDAKSTELIKATDNIADHIQDLEIASSSATAEEELRDLRERLCRLQGENKRLTEVNGEFEKTIGVLTAESSEAAAKSADLAEQLVEFKNRFSEHPEFEKLFEKEKKEQRCVRCESSTAEKEHLRTRVDALQAELFDVRAELEETQDFVVRNTDLWNRNSADVERLTSEKSKLEERLKSILGSNESHLVVLRSLVTEMRSLHADVKTDTVETFRSLGACHADLTRAIQEHIAADAADKCVTDVEVLASTSQRLQHQLSGVRVKLEATEAALSSSEDEVERISKELSEERRTSVSLQEEVQHLQSTEAGTTDHMTSLQETLNAASARFEEVQVEMTNNIVEFSTKEERLNLVIEELTEQVRLLEDHNEKLRVELADRTREIVEASAALEESRVECEQMTQKLSVATQTITNLEIDLAEKDATVKELADDLQTTSDKVSRLSDEVQQQHEQLRAKTSVELDLTNNLSAAKLECAKLGGDLEQLQAEHSTVLSRLESLKQQQATVTHEQQTAVAEAANLHKQMNDLQDELEFASATNKSLESSLSKLKLQGQTERSKLEQQVDSLSAELEATRSNMIDVDVLKSLEGEKADLARKIQDLEGENEDFTQKIENLDGEKRDLAQRIQNLEGDKASLTQRLHDLEAENADITRRIQDLEVDKLNLTKQIQEKQETIEKLEAAMESHEAMKNKMIGLELELSASKEDVSSRTEQLKTLESTLSILSSRTEEEISCTKKDLALKDSALSDLKSKLETSLMEATDLQSRLNETQSSLEDVQVEKQSLHEDLLQKLRKTEESKNEQINQLENDLTQKSSTLEDLEAQFAASSSALSEKSLKVTELTECLQDQTTSATLKISELSEQLTQKDAIISDLQATLEEEATHKRGFEEKVSSLTERLVFEENRCRELQSARASMDDRMAVLDADLEERNKELEGVRRAKEAADADVSSIREELEELRSAVPVAESEKAQLRTTLQDTEATLDQTRTALEVAELEKRRTAEELSTKIAEVMQCGEQVASLQLLRRELEEKNVDLEKEMETREKNSVMEVQRCKSELAVLQDQLSKSDERIASLTSELEAHNAELLTTKQLLCDESAKNETIVQEMSQRADEVVVLTSKLAATELQLQSTLQDYEGKICEKEEALTGARNETQELRLLLDESETNSAEMETSLRQELDNTRNKLEESKAEVNAAKTETQQLQKGLNEIDETTSKSLAEIAEVTVKTHEEAQAVCECIFKRIGDVQEKAANSIGLFTERLATIQTTADAVREKLRQTSKERDALLSEKLESENERQSLLDRLEERETYLSGFQKKTELVANELRSEIEEKNVEISKLSLVQEEKENMYAQLESAKTSMEQLQTDLETSERERSSLSERHVVVDKELGDMRFKASDLETQLLGERENHSLCKENLSQTTSERDELQEQLDKFFEEKQRLLDTYKSLESDKESTVTEMKRRQAEMYEALQALGREHVDLQVDLQKHFDRCWIPDEQVLACMHCTKEFSMTVRKHHCRVCGLIFCKECSSRSAKLVHSKKPVRVCDGCYVEVTAKTRRQSLAT